MATKEHRELDKQLGKQESRIKRAFALFVKNTKNQNINNEITEAISTGSINQVLDTVDENIFLLGDAVSDSFDSAGKQEIENLKKKTSGIVLSFDPSHPVAAELSSKNRLEFVREMLNSQRDSIRGALTVAFSDGLGPVQTARAFRNAIGLTAKQEKSVRNYERLLSENNRESLTRGLRDRRFDRTIERAASSGAPLSGAQVNKMVDRYRARFVQFRAEFIARTEGVKATSMARDEAMRQASESAEIDPGRITRVWNITDDTRVRDFHESMSGQRRAPGEPFVDGLGNTLRFPGDPLAPIETIAHCRCVVTVEFS